MNQHYHLVPINRAEAALIGSALMLVRELVGPEPDEDEMRQFMGAENAAEMAEVVRNLPDLFRRIVGRPDLDIDDVTETADKIMAEQGYDYSIGQGAAAEPMFREPDEDEPVH